MLKFIYEELLDENRAVTFDGETYPPNGWAVCLAGGPGSGKGYSQGRFIPIDAKVFDVDELKKTFRQAIKHDDSKFGKYVNKREYDMSNPKDVSDLHYAVKSSGIEMKQQDAYFKYNNRLENVIFDMTGDDPNRLIKKATTAEDLGYKTSLIWVVTNREQAMVQNALRSRSVGDAVLHSKHNSIAQNLYKFITTDAGKYFDECWVIFSSNPHVGGSNAESQWLAKNRTIQLTKQGDRFVPTNKEAARIFMTLGELEPTPEHPTRYKDFNTVKSIVNNADVTSATASEYDWGDTSFKW